MNTAIHSFLEELGLSEKETILYIASLQSGPQSASTFSKKTGIARSTVNFIFEQLIEKGFATKENRESTTYFQVVAPEMLEYILLERQAKAKKQLSEFETLLPLLNNLKSQNSLASTVTYYSGLESLKRTIDDVSKEDQTVYFISSHNNMHPEIREYVERSYLPAAKRHRNKNKMIVSAGDSTQKYLKMASDAYDEVYTVNSDIYPFKLTTAIYGDKVAFISYEPKDLSGMIIENKLIAEHMKALFKVAKDHFKR